MNYVQSIMLSGSIGTVVQVECQLSNGLPTIVIVGLGNKAVDEAKERIRSAFASTGIALPKKRITINLAPADLPKDSTSLDLAIAVAIMRANKDSTLKISEKCVIIGEVGLGGDVRSVRGVIGKLLAARRLGVTQFIIPAANLDQACLVPEVEIFPVSNLTEVTQPLKRYSGVQTIPASTTSAATLFTEIAGQAQAKRALEIVAAGGHNILLTGPPGTGKSMLAKALPSLLPPLSHQEMLEITHLYSLASSKYDELVTHRPFRSPHHSSSHVSIVGGGALARPGEITLSHRGILFLDELPEFGRSTIEALRQPLEDRLITVARAKQTVEYPADFILVATANPCPCGFYSTARECTCTPGQIQRYMQKLSGPIIDRIDLHVPVETVEHDKLLSSKNGQDHIEQIRQRILQARKMQRERFKRPEKTNANMSNKEIKQYSLFSKESKALLDEAAIRLQISARSYMRLVKVARTIADLESSRYVEPHHISEALQYRTSRPQ